MRNSAVPFKSILILSALLLCFTVGARTRFIRVMFSGNTSKSATIIWDQQRGDFKGLYCDTINPELSQYKDAKPLTSSNTCRLLSFLNNFLSKSLVPFTAPFLISVKFL